jgi:LysR family nitrogen assimilation transcriptional regulator
MAGVTSAERIARVVRAELDLRQVQHFVAIFEEQSIAGAARRLSVVPAAVSMQLRRLESTFGVVLFDRGPHGVVPKALAHDIYPRCLAVLRELDALGETLHAAAGPDAGSLRIGVTPSIAHGILGVVLGRFREQHPRVEVFCYEAYSEGLIERVVQGALDFAVVTMDVNAGILSQELLYTEPLMVVARTGTGVCERTSYPARELVGRTVILPPRANFLRTWIENELANAGIALSPIVEMASLSAVFGMVRETDALAILPSVVLRNGRLPDDVYSVPLVEPTIARTLVAAFPLAKERHAPAQAFIELLRASLENSD